MEFGPGGGEVWEGVGEGDAAAIAELDLGGEGGAAGVAEGFGSGVDAVGGGGEGDGDAGKWGQRLGWQQGAGEQRGQKEGGDGRKRETEGH